MIVLIPIMLVQLYIIMYMMKREETRRDSFRERRAAQFEALMRILKSNKED